METYRHNAKRVPSVTGNVIPERAFTRAGYDALLERVYADLAPHDPEGILRHPWVNARGAIARFDRGSIEIRVIDSQECPDADVAVVGAAAAAVRALAEERFARGAEQRSWDEARLAEMLLRTIESGDRAVINDAEYLRCLGYPDGPKATAGDVWRHLAETTGAVGLDAMLRHGCLAARILAALGSPAPGTTLRRAALREVYGELARCMAAGERFVP
jgi:hypothetical protein